MPLVSTGVRYKPQPTNRTNILSHYFKGIPLLKKKRSIVVDFFKIKGRRKLRFHNCSRLKRSGPPLSFLLWTYYCIYSFAFSKVRTSLASNPRSILLQNPFSFQKLIFLYYPLLSLRFSLNECHRPPKSWEISSSKQKKLQPRSPSSCYSRQYTGSPLHYILIRVLHQFTLQIHGLPILLEPTPSKLLLRALTDTLTIPYKTQHNTQHPSLLLFLGGNSF